MNHMLELKELLSTTH